MARYRRRRYAQPATSPLAKADSSSCMLGFESPHTAKGNKNDHQVGGRGIGVFVRGTKIFTACRLQASLTRSARQMRTPRLAMRGAVVRVLYSTAKGKKNDHQMMVVFLWQGNRDSNPNIQSQSLLCCRYTIPLCHNGLYFSTHYFICQ